MFVLINFIELLGQKMPKEGKARVLTENEFKRRLTIARDAQMPERNVAIIYCSFGLGLRAKEIAALKISDIFDNELNVLEEINLTRSMTKGEKQRHIYINNKKIIKALTEYITVRKDNDVLFNYNDWLFKTQRKQKFSPDVLQKWFRKLYDKTGIKSASSHSGRRTFITRLIEQGADIKAVSNLAGHASITTTASYVYSNPDRLKRISNLAVF